MSFSNDCFTFDSHLPQFIDCTTDIEEQWNDFTNDIHMKPKKCPVTLIAQKAFVVCIGLLVCLVFVGGLYRDKLRSAISAFKADTISSINVDEVVDTFSTLSCNTDDKNELQCLVQMHPQIPETRNCYTAHDTVNHSFCGRLCT